MNVFKPQGSLLFKLNYRAYMLILAVGMSSTFYFIWPRQINSTLAINNLKTTTEARLFFILSLVSLLIQVLPAVGSAINLSTR